MDATTVMESIRAVQERRQAEVGSARGALRELQEQLEGISA
jgi:hypothetical protein